MAFIPSGQKTMNELNGDKLKEIDLPKSPKTNSKNIFDSSGKTNSTSPESFYMKYSDEVDWTDKGYENFDDIIENVSKRFDIKTFRDATGRKPKTQGLVSKILTDEDEKMLMKLYGDEFELEKSIDERLKMETIEYKTPFDSSTKSINDYIKSIYKIVEETLLSSIKPKEIFRVETFKSPFVGLDIKITGNLFDNHMLQPLTHTLKIRINSIYGSFCERRDIDNITSSLYSVAKICNYTNNIINAINNTFFEYINAENVIETAIRNNPQIKGMQFLSNIYTGEIKNMSQTELSKNLKIVNDNIFLISECIYLEFGKVFDISLFKSYVYRKIAESGYYSMDNIHKDAVDNIIYKICDKLRGSKHYSIENALLDKLRKESDDEIMDYINSMNTSYKKYPGGWQ